MPVQWNSPSPIPPFTLQADGAIATVLGAPDPAGMAPFLPIGLIDAITIHVTDQPIDTRLPLHELTNADILIASADDRASVADVAHALAPDKTATTLRLDPAHPLPGPAVAWTTIDVLILSPRQTADISDDTISTLLAGGTTIVVASDAPPDSRWPWRSLGQFFILAAPPPLSPQSAAAANVLYSSWQPGLADFSRRQAGLFALAVGLALVATSLLRWKWMLPAFAVAVLFAVSAFGAWQTTQPAVASASADVLVRSGAIERADQWIIQKCTCPTISMIPFDAVPIPAVENSQQAGDLSILCLSSGQPLELRWQFMTAANPPKITIVQRVRPAPSAPMAPIAMDPSLTSPISPVAQSIYHRPIIGGLPIETNPAINPQAPDSNQYPIHWPGIVIESANP